MAQLSRFSQFGECVEKRWAFRGQSHRTTLIAAVKNNITLLVIMVRTKANLSFAALLAKVQA
jgi:hypothetical protein